MVADRRLIELEPRSDIANADWLSLLGQQIKHFQPCGITQYFESRGKGLYLISPETWGLDTHGARVVLTADWNSCDTHDYVAFTGAELGRTRSMPVYVTTRSGPERLTGYGTT